MPALPSLLILTHLIGLVLAVGCATAKLTLLARCRSDDAFVPVFVAVMRPLTRLIIAGLVLLTLSGVAFLFTGYALTPLLIGKLVMVGVVWVLGPIIDNVIEPRFRQHAPGPGQPPTPAFIAALNRYLLMESVATGLFYAIVVSWVLF